MAEDTKTTRRTWTDEQKREVLAYGNEHGTAAAVEHYKLATSVYRRWKKEFGAKPTGRKLKWTPEKIAEVMKFRETHTITETIAKYKISGSQIHQWKTGKVYYKSKKQARLNGASVKVHGGGNGIGASDEVRIHLRNYEKARLKWIRADERNTPPPYDVFAELALRALREEE